MVDFLYLIISKIHGIAWSEIRMTLSFFVLILALWTWLILKIFE